MYVRSPHARPDTRAARRRALVHKQIGDNILDAIGHTPLIRLNRIPAGVISATVLAKIETFNPGNSIKDRMALKLSLIHI